MNSQQEGDYLLAIWQASRALPPLERLEVLMADFFSPLPPCETEYELTLGRVREEMA